MSTSPLDVEIVIPAHNERAALEGSVRMLHGYLSTAFPFSWQITIVDNASTDGTLQIARRLMYELPHTGADAGTISTRESPSSTHGLRGVARLVVHRPPSTPPALAAPRRPVHAP